MSAHTPGPWRNGVNQIRDEENRLIAWLGFGRRGVSQRLSADEQAANARLISAAPDLLEATCRAIVVFEAGIVRDDAGVVAFFWNAYAKATGEPSAPTPKGRSPAA